jgi:hypothetical protein
MSYAEKRRNARRSASIIKRGLLKKPFVIELNKAEGERALFALQHGSVFSLGSLDFAVQHIEILYPDGLPTRAFAEVVQFALP